MEEAQHGPSRRWSLGHGMLQLRQGATEVFTLRNPRKKHILPETREVTISFGNLALPGLSAPRRRPGARRAPGQGAPEGPWCRTQVNSRGRRLAQALRRSLAPSSRKLSPRSTSASSRTSGRSCSRRCETPGATPRATTRRGSKRRTGSATRTPAALGMRLRL